MSNLPASHEAFINRFNAGRAQRPASVSTGELLLKVNDRTGEMTYGPEREILTPGRPFVVPINGLRHGFMMWKGGKIASRHIVDLSAGVPIPEPDEDWAKFGKDGPRPAHEMVLNSLEERGFRLLLIASESSARRMDNLASDIATQLRTPEGQYGFRNPAIKGEVDKYYSKPYSRDVWFFNPVLYDWLHDDGVRLLSENRNFAIEDGSSQDSPPWTEYESVGDVTEDEYAILG